jgi:hypothetical protein
MNYLNGGATIHVDSSRSTQHLRTNEAAHFISHDPFPCPFMGAEPGPSAFLRGPYDTAYEHDHDYHGRNGF